MRIEISKIVLFQGYIYVSSQPLHFTGVYMGMSWNEQCHVKKKNTLHSDFKKSEALSVLMDLIWTENWVSTKAKNCLRIETKKLRLHKKNPSFSLKLSSNVKNYLSSLYIRVRNGPKIPCVWVETEHNTQLSEMPI